MATSPLTVLVWVFAVSTGALGTVSACAAGLAIRNRRRRENGVYAGILAGNPASQVLNVVTAADYLADPALRGQISLKPTTGTDPSAHGDHNGPLPAV